MESVRLVLRQLSSTLAVRRLAEQRLDDERRLAEQERLGMLGLVAASLAHEVKNPLSSMKALAQTVHEELSESEEHSERTRDLGLIIDQIDRLHGVTREILEFARPTHGGQLRELKEMTLSAAYVLGQEARRNAVSIDTSAVSEVGAVPGTPASWQTVIFNLILNAIRHAPAGSHVIVRLEREAGGQGLRFETQNAGPAIVESIAVHLFEPFVSEGGTGLGLALVKRRVEALGGTVELENVPDRILFRVRLPLEEATPAQVTPSEEAHS